METLKDPPSHKGFGRLDPRVRILAALVTVLFIVTTPPDRPLRFAVHSALIAGFVLLFRVPARVLLRRLGVIVPFVLVVGLAAGFPHLLGRGAGEGWPWASVLVKPGLAAVAVAAFTATLGPQGLLQGLAGLRVPGILVMLLFFLTRYFPLLSGEVARMRWAVEARAPGRIPPRRGFAALGGIVGSLFLRSYDRGERIHWAMCARGFTGEIRYPPLPRPRPGDLIFLLSVLAVLAASAALPR